MTVSNRSFIAFLGTLLVLLLPSGLVSGQSADPPRGDARIVVISDMNSSYGSTYYGPEIDSTVARIRDLWQPDFVLAGGDMVAGQDNSLSDAEVRAMWAAFDEHVAAPLREASVPFGFTIGNHDGSALGGYERDRNLASEFWNDPDHDPQLAFVDSTHFPFYYTFTSGDIFVLVWDASSATVQDRAWVEQALSSDAAQSARLRLAVGHLPIYGVAIGRNTAGEVLSNPEEMRALLEEHDVHTYVSGHHHAYYPGRRGMMQFLHAGALGAGERQLTGTNEAPYKTVTVVDIDLETEETVYTTYEPLTWRVIETETLPRTIRGVNGFVLRRDVRPEGIYGGVLSPYHVPEDVSSDAQGDVEATVEEGQLVIEGSFNGLSSALYRDDGAAVYLSKGANGSAGTRVQALDLTDAGDGSGTFEGSYELTSDDQDELVAGGFFVSVLTADHQGGELRAQLLGETNQPPDSATVDSPEPGAEVQVEDRLGLRLVKIRWNNAEDPDGDPVRYIYQIAGDPAFSDVWLEAKMGVETTYSANQPDLYGLLEANGFADGTRVDTYHRVVTTDGSSATVADPVHIVLTMGEPVAAERADEPSAFVLHDVYPNPADGELTAHLNLATNTDVDARIFNVLGQEVLSVRTERLPAGARRLLRFAIDDLPAGVYVLRVSGVDGRGHTHLRSHPFVVAR